YRRPPAGAARRREPAPRPRRARLRRRKAAAPASPAPRRQPEKRRSSHLLPWLSQKTRLVEPCRISGPPPAGQSRSSTRVSEYQEKAAMPVVVPQQLFGCQSYDTMTDLARKPAGPCLAAEAGAWWAPADGR